MAVISLKSPQKPSKPLNLNNRGNSKMKDKLTLRQQKHPHFLDIPLIQKTEPDPTTSPFMLALAISKTYESASTPSMLPVCLINKFSDTE